MGKELLSEQELLGVINEALANKFPHKDSRKEVLDFLKDIHSHYGTYHNHKENVGWAGVALYAVLALGIASALREVALSLQARVFVSVVIAGACGICWIYVHMQFQLRKRAADTVAACIQLRSNIVANTSFEVTPIDWAPPISTMTPGMQSSHVLPRIVQSATEELASQGQSSRQLLERCAYGLLLGLSGALLVRVWG